MIQVACIQFSIMLTVTICIYYHFLPPPLKCVCTLRLKIFRSNSETRRSRWAAWKSESSPCRLTRPTRTRPWRPWRRPWPRRWGAGPGCSETCPSCLPMSQCVCRWGDLIQKAKAVSLGRRGPRPLYCCRHTWCKGNKPISFVPVAASVAPQGVAEVCKLAECPPRMIREEQEELLLGTRSSRTWEGGTLRHRLWGSDGELVLLSCPSVPSLFVGFSYSYDAPAVFLVMALPLHCAFMSRVFQGWLTK